MIDTDKYEGHTPAPWRIEYGDMEQYGETDTVLSGIEVVALDVMRQDAQLIADSPLLLVEVKRLREELAQTRECLWWCYDLKRFGNEMKGEDWDFIGRLLGADTDHNDNAWEGEEE